MTLKIRILIVVLSILVQLLPSCGLTAKQETVEIPDEISFDLSPAGPSAYYAGGGAIVLPAIEG